MAVFTHGSIPANAAKGWIDVTSRYLLSPDFADNRNDGWTWVSDASSQAVRCEAMEFWNGTWDLWQTIDNLPAGEYRLSVQSYYRCRDNDPGYQDFLYGGEDITGVMYAGNTWQPLVSIYSYHFPINDTPSGCWGYWNSDENATWYFPNTMESGTNAFSRGAYWNTMTFTHHGGSLRLGLRNEAWVKSNWCLFDNFRLEYYGEIVPVTDLVLNLNNVTMVCSETIPIIAHTYPENATINTVSWTTSNSQVATIDDNGLVTAHQQGNARITASTTDGSNLTATCDVRVVHNPATKGSLVVNEIMASNVDQFVSPAYNFDGWIELYNPTNQAVELGDMYFSDDASNLKKWHTPVALGVVPASGYTVVWFDSNRLCQTNAPFKLDVDGGTLFISDAKGQILVQQDYPESLPRVSYARTTDGNDEWALSYRPSPGETNNTGTFAKQQLAPPTVNEPSQFFNGTLTVNVDIPAGCTLRYTTDGTLPEESNGTYNGQVSRTGQLTISKTTCFRFRLFADGYLPSPTTTRSYIVRDRDYTLPVVSVVSDPRFLYDDMLGVYVQGKNGRPGNGQSSPCNWNMDWDRPVNFSFLTADGEMVLNQDVDLEMCGGWSRAWEPHSFKLKGNKELSGSKRFDYPFFAAKPYINNRTLQIRNGGNDNSCRIKDPAIATIVQRSGVDIDLQSYFPVHEFINGQYIGVLNVREPNNKHYVDANYGWDDDEIDQFEISPDSFYVQRCGTSQAYDRLVELSAYAADPSVYAQIRKMLDIDEYINYMAAECYLGSDDWLRNNVKAFRYRDGGRFRFVMFDTDFAFARSSNMFREMMNMEKNFAFNALLPGGEVIVTDITLITLFRQLLQNDDFRRQFIDTYCLMGGSVFDPSRCNAIIDELTSVSAPAMALEGGSPYSTANDVKNKFQNRELTMTQAMKNYNLFKLTGVEAQPVSLRSDTDGARIEVNGINVPTGAFNGHLFAPVTLKAVAPAGYVFKGWLNDNVAQTEIFGKGSIWQYYDKGYPGTDDWKLLDYSVAGWSSAQAPLGYGMNGVKTTISYGNNSNNKIPTYYFRHRFTLNEKPADNAVFMFNYSVDDGFVVYVNGTEAGRYNMPSGTVNHNTYTTTWAGSVPDEGSIQLKGGLFRLGTNVISVEVHNTSGSSSDIYFDASLTGEIHKTQQTDLFSTEPELTLPQGNVGLIACYREMTAEERKAAGMNPVCINEISAANSVYVNEYGKKNDWIELYNTTGKVQDVAGMYLTDNLDNPKKYQLPTGSALTKIPAHGRLIIWCDKLDDTPQALHAPFKLAAEGGAVALAAADMSWTDKLYYGAHDGNHTVGRYPDGAADIFLMTVPTIAKTNQLNSYDEVSDQQTLDVNGRLVASVNGLRIGYANETLLLHSDDADYAHLEIITVSGQLVETTVVNMHNGRSTFSITHLQPGIYIARATDNIGNTVTRKIVKH